MIDRLIAAIDALISQQLNAIMHHPDFQRLEATWRSLAAIVNSLAPGSDVRVRVLNVTKRELPAFLEAEAGIEASALWRHVYEDVYGRYAADPFAVLVGDYEFDRSQQDIALLTRISQVAAAAHAPFLSAASPRMLGLESFVELPDRRDLSRLLDEHDCQNEAWLSFRDSENSRFVVLTLPRLLVRLPYGADALPIKPFGFEEETADRHEHYLWGNAAYALARRLTEAFDRHHWCTAIVGPEGGGLVQGLPIHCFKTREGGVGSKCPTEVLISDTREKELSDLGFAAVSHCRGTDYAAFFSINSTQRPKRYDDDAATANADLSRRIQYLMTTSRIAHYLKAICRDKIGSFASRSQVQSFLNGWINNYVLDQDDASQEAKAKMPLREARIEVIEDKRRPGCYKAVAHLKPHFQLEERNVSLRVVADLAGTPPSAARAADAGAFTGRDRFSLSSGDLGTLAGRSAREMWEPQLESRGDPARPGRLLRAGPPRVAFSYDSTCLADKVQFTVFAPEVVGPAGCYTIDLWAHLPAQQAGVFHQALRLQDGRSRQVRVKKGVPVERGSVLQVQLSLPGFRVDEPEDQLVWAGEAANATFAFRVPDDALLGMHLGVIRVYACGLQLARIQFVLQVGKEAGEPAALPARQQRLRSAFASYASEDRDEVLARVQGMQKILPQLDVFLDVLALRSGEHWPERLAQEVEARDVFYLFWSLPASRSAWVEREWRLALARRGIDYIDPVPLAPPDVVPPPAELAQDLHFNDWVLAYRRGRGGQSSPAA